MQKKIIKKLTIGITSFFLFVQTIMPISFAVSAQESAAPQAQASAEADTQVTLTFQKGASEEESHNFVVTSPTDSKMYAAIYYKQENNPEESPYAIFDSFENKKDQEHEISAETCSGEDCTKQDVSFGIAKFYVPSEKVLYTQRFQRENDTLQISAEDTQSDVEQIEDEEKIREFLAPTEEDEQWLKEPIIATPSTTPIPTETNTNDDETAQDETVEDTEELASPEASESPSLVPENPESSAEGQTEDATQDDLVEEDQEMDATWNIMEEEKKAELIGSIEKDKTYVFPFNDKMTITFTQLPTSLPSFIPFFGKDYTFYIREVSLSPEEQEQLGALTEKLYEIESNLEDETFQYKVTFPVDTAEKDSLEVKYAETKEDLLQGKYESQQVEVKDGFVENIEPWNHFTFFTITDPNPPHDVTAVGNIADNDNANNQDGSVYTETGSWMMSGCEGYSFPGGTTRFTQDGNGQNTATWTFQVPQTGEYQVFASWASHSNRATAAPYTIFSDDVEESVTVDQSSADSTCGWSEFQPIGSVHTFTEGETYTVVLSNDNAGGVVSADAIRVESVGDLQPGPVAQPGICEENEPYVLTFDDLAADTEVTNQYEDYGVVFTDSGIVQQFPDDASHALLSKPNAVRLNPNAVGDVQTVFEFVNPEDPTQPMTATNISFMTRDAVASGKHIFDVTYYDIDGSEIHTIQVVNDGNYHKLVEIPSAARIKVTLAPGNGGAKFDNLQYTFADCGEQDDVPPEDDNPIEQPQECVQGGSAWAYAVVSSAQGEGWNGHIIESRVTPSNALGATTPRDNNYPENTFFSLGKNGSITLSFEHPLSIEDGADLEVYEATNGRVSYHTERTQVEISIDGTPGSWVKVGEITNKQYPNQVDLSSTGLATYQYVRLTDMTTDADIGGVWSDGYDLDALRGLHQSCAQTPSDDEDDPVQPADVTLSVCKEKEGEPNTPVSGWNMTLGGIEDVLIQEGIEVRANNPEPETTDVLEAGAAYKVVVSGTWMNNSRAVDAEYYSDDDWATETDMADNAGRDEKQLDFIINEENVEWQALQQPHTYQTTVSGTGAPLSIRIFDEDQDPTGLLWYRDNSGSLMVSIYKEEPMGETKATQEPDGCATFDVDPGTYTLTEEQRVGWVTVSDPTIDGSITVTEEGTNTFTFVNREEEGGELPADSIPFPAKALTCVDMSGYSNGSSVHGETIENVTLESVDSAADIIVVEEGDAAHAVYGAANGGGSVPNGGLSYDNEFGSKGIALINSSGIRNSDEIKYTFTNPVTEFSVDVLDVGDFNPLFATEHGFTLTAYNSNDEVISSTNLTFDSTNQTNPRLSEAFGDLYISGDAVTASKTEMQPGYYRLKVTGTEEDDIAYAVYTATNNSETRTARLSDPNHAFSNVCYTEQQEPEEPQDETGTLSILKLICEDGEVINNTTFRSAEDGVTLNEGQFRPTGEGSINGVAIDEVAQNLDQFPGCRLAEEGEVTFAVDYYPEENLGHGQPTTAPVPLPETYYDTDANGMVTLTDLQVAGRYEVREENEDGESYEGILGFACYRNGTGHGDTENAGEYVIIDAERGAVNNEGACVGFNLPLPEEPLVDECVLEEPHWIGSVVEVNQGTQRGGDALIPNISDLNAVVGEDDGFAHETDAAQHSGFYSMGYGASYAYSDGVSVLPVEESSSITVTFDAPVANRAGDDILFYEITAYRGTYPEERAFVEVSQDGITWIPVEGVLLSSDDTNGISAIDIDDADTSLEWIQYVRLTDQTDWSAMNDEADGYDLDAAYAYTRYDEECLDPTPSPTPPIIDPPIEPETPPTAQTCIDFTDSAQAGSNVSDFLAAEGITLELGDENAEAQVIQVGSYPRAYNGSADSGSTINACINKNNDGGGFGIFHPGDNDGVNVISHDMTFTFEDGKEVTEFVLGMKDYGDYQTREKSHSITLVAKNAAGEVVGEAVPLVFDGSDSSILPEQRDACTANVGDPGNYYFALSADAGELIKTIEFAATDGSSDLSDWGIGFTNVCMTHAQPTATPDPSVSPSPNPSPDPSVSPSPTPTTEPLTGQGALLVRETNSTLNEAYEVVQDLQPGDDYVVTIQVTAQDGPVDNVVLSHLPKEYITPRQGTHVFRSSTRGPISIEEAVFSSPGSWNLGDMTEDETITVTYVADVKGNPHAGVHNDLTWAEGDPEQPEPVLAQGYDSEYVDGEFVGSKINIVRESADVAGVSINVEREEQREEIVEEEGEVLGASTLPQTGGRTLWVLLASMLMLLGITLVSVGISSKKGKKNDHIYKHRAFSIGMFRRNASIKRLAVTFIAGGMFVGFFTGSVLAAETSVRISEPTRRLNETSFNIAFVTLDWPGRPVVVKCLVKKPGSSEFAQFQSDITTKEGGNSGVCAVNSSVVNQNETIYQFKVTAQAVGSSTVMESNVVTIEYNTTSPGTPTDFSKSKNGCEYAVRFKTANDSGRTKYVEIYRSESTEFRVDGGTRVGQISAGSNESKEFRNQSPDCGKTYYYAVRAFDEFGNGSGVTGDSVVKVVTTTTTVVTNNTATADAGTTTVATTDQGGGGGAIAVDTTGNVAAPDEGDEDAEVQGAATEAGEEDEEETQEEQPEDEEQTEEEQQDTVVEDTNNEEVLGEQTGEESNSMAMEQDNAENPLAPAEEESNNALVWVIGVVGVIVIGVVGFIIYAKRT